MIWHGFYLKNACMHCRASLSQSLTHVCFMTLHASSAMEVGGGGMMDIWVSKFWDILSVILNLKKKKKNFEFSKGVCVCPDPPQPHTYLLTLSRSPHAMSLCTSYKNCIDYLTFVDLVYLYPYFAVYRNFHGTLPCN